MSNTLIFKDLVVMMPLLQSRNKALPFLSEFAHKHCLAALAGARIKVASHVRG